MLNEGSKPRNQKGFPSLMNGFSANSAKCQFKLPGVGWKRGCNSNKFFDFDVQERRKASFSNNNENPTGIVSMPCQFLAQQQPSRARNHSGLMIRHDTVLYYRTDWVNVGRYMLAWLKKGPTNR